MSEIDGQAPTGDGPPNGFGIASERRGTRMRIIVSGELDIATAPQLDDALATLVDDGTPLLIDLSAVTFMDSTGLRSLLGVRGAHDDVRFVLSEACQRVVDITGVHDRLPGPLED